MTQKISDLKQDNESLTVFLHIFSDQEIKSELPFKQKRAVDFTS